MIYFIVSALPLSPSFGLFPSQDGWQGLFGRGLQTRLLVNAVQGMLFSVLFKYFQSTSTAGK